MQERRESAAYVRAVRDYDVRYVVVVGYPCKTPLPSTVLERLRPKVSICTHKFASKEFLWLAEHGPGDGRYTTTTSTADR